MRPVRRLPWRQSQTQDQGGGPARLGASRVGATARRELLAVVPDLQEVGSEACNGTELLIDVDEKWGAVSRHGSEEARMIDDDQVGIDLMHPDHDLLLR